MQLVVVAPEDSKSRTWASVPHPSIKEICYFTLEQLLDDGTSAMFLRIVHHVASRLVLLVPRTQLPDKIRRGLRPVGRRMYSYTEPYIHEGREGLTAILETFKISSKRGRQSVAKIGSADAHELHAAQTMQRNYNAGVNVIFGGATPKVNTPEEAISGKRPSRRSMRPARPSRTLASAKTSTSPTQPTPSVEVSPAAAKPGAFGLSRIARPPAPTEETPEVESIEPTTPSESSVMVPVADALAAPSEEELAAVDVKVVDEPEPVASEETLVASEETPETPTLESAEPEPESEPEVDRESPLTEAQLIAPDMESAPAIEEADADEAGGGAEKPAPRKRTPRKAEEKGTSGKSKAKAKKKKQPTKKAKSH